MSGAASSQLADLQRDVREWRERCVKAEAERDRLQNWILSKLKTMRHYRAPSDDRPLIQEIQGWMHVLCADYDELKDILPECDRRGRDNETLKAERDRLAALVVRAMDVIESIACIKHLDEPWRCEERLDPACRARLIVRDPAAQAVLSERRALLDLQNAVTLVRTIRSGLRVLETPILADAVAVMFDKLAAVEAARAR